MAKYSVSALIPTYIEVEAESFKDAIEKAFEKDENLATYYGCDGICVTNLETEEQYEEK